MDIGWKLSGKDKFIGNGWKNGSKETGPASVMNRKLSSPGSRVVPNGALWRNSPSVFRKIAARLRKSY